MIIRLKNWRNIRRRHQALLLTLFILHIGIWGCGGGDTLPSGPDSGGTGDLTTGDTGTTSELWTRVEMKVLDYTGMIMPHVNAVPDQYQNIQTAFYGNSDSSERPYGIYHFTFDIEQLSAGATSVVQQVDNCNTLSLAITAGDTAVVGYQGGEVKTCGDADQGDAMLSVQNGNAWSEFTGGIGYVDRNPVINDGLAGQKMALAIDTHGDVHMAYQFFYEGCDAFGMGYPDLLYVKKTADALGGDVEEETIEGNVFSSFGNATVQNNVGEAISILLDPEDNPAAFYYASLVSDHEYGLRIARRLNGEWVPAWIDQNVVVAAVSGALTDDGALAVAYYVDEVSTDGTLRQILKFAVETETGWVSQIVDESSRCGKYCSLAFDTAGHPAIAYHDLETNSGSREKKDLKLAVFDGASWAVETVAEAGTIGLYNTMWFDENGTAYICSYSETDKTIYLFYR